MFQGIDGCRHHFGGELHQIGATRKNGRLGEPDESSFELISRLRRRLDIDQNIAAADINLIGQREGDTLPCDGARQIAISGDDPGYLTLTSGGQDFQAIAGAHLSTGDAPGKATEIQVRPIHPLHRHPQRLRLRVIPDRDALQMTQQSRPGIPWCVGPCSMMLSP